MAVWSAILATAWLLVFSIMIRTSVNVCLLYSMQPMFSTIEDIYVALVDTDRGQKEKVHFYDTAGLVNCLFSISAFQVC